MYTVFQLVYLDAAESIVFIRAYFSEIHIECSEGNAHLFRPKWLPGCTTCSITWGPSPRRLPGLVYFSSLAISQFLILFGQEALHCHFPLGFANHVASAIFRISGWLVEQFVDVEGRETLLGWSLYALTRHTDLTETQVPQITALDSQS